MRIEKKEEIFYKKKYLVYKRLRCGEKGRDGIRIQTHETAQTSI
jgi:hypothetical protein